ncbi:hypothetical protein [Tritonibacter horizontis]|uniref:Uncharacterized protein n=1 Tax=Tritonibacter horizontis TaxID=1768241 RepID=A0A132BZR0_9RHOB|nr:hypothetical protein [Tritonibacter horizontis]KUP93833.1 hypothetical protein TRIHO_13250 [Tritonibacter horizontis]
MHPALPVTLIAALGLGLVSCGKLNEDKYPRFDGVPFRVSAKAINKRETLADFRVEVADATRSQSGAYAAADHAAKSYCIENYGTSKFDWTNITVGPDGSYGLHLDNGAGVFTGTCKP